MPISIELDPRNNEKRVHSVSSSALVQASSNEQTGLKFKVKHSKVLLGVLNEHILNDWFGYRSQDNNSYDSNISSELNKWLLA